MGKESAKNNERVEKFKADSESYRRLLDEVSESYRRQRDEDSESHHRQLGEAMKKLESIEKEKDEYFKERNEALYKLDGFKLYKKAVLEGNMKTAQTWIQQYDL